jgi:hypothetical protein
MTKTIIKIATKDLIGRDCKTLQDDGSWFYSIFEDEDLVSFEQFVEFELQDGWLWCPRESWAVKAEKGDA